MKFDRNKAREDLLAQTQLSFQTKDFAGLGASYLKPLPRPSWSCKEGKHLIDIIPWIAGDNFPNPKVKPGAFVYHLDVFIHRNIGPTDSQFLCLASNFQKRCPICEKLKELRLASAEKELIDAVRPKRRTVYNIVCLDTSMEEEKGVQVWELAHFFMEQKLASLAERPRTGGFVGFADPDTGKSISFERKGSGFENTQFLGHQFVDREGYIIPDALLEQAVPLEEFLVIPTYDELYESFYNKKPAPDEDGGGTQPRRLMRGQKTPAEDSNNPCKFGGVFGKSIDNLVQCNECDLYDECAIASKGEPVPVAQEQTSGTRRRAPQETQEAPAAPAPAESTTRVRRRTLA